MASFFGEILEPTSRAIFEEFIDDEEEIKPIELHLRWFQTKEIVPADLNTVLIYHGKLSVVFAESYLIAENSAPVGEITFAERPDNDGNEVLNQKKKLLPSRIYLDNNNFICLVSPAVSSDFAFQFTNCIAPLLKIAKKIVIFTVECINNYKTLSLRDLPPAFVRELKTSHGSTGYLVDELPVPNIVSDVPAAVLSWCQIYKKDASLYVCYTDQQKLDSVTASPYLSVIKKLNSAFIKNSKPNFSRKKFYGNPDIIGGSSNIYI